jgi:hypothetical protein
VLWSWLSGRSLSGGIGRLWHRPEAVAAPVSVAERPIDGLLGYGRPQATPPLATLSGADRTATTNET